MHGATKSTTPVTVGWTTAHNRVLEMVHLTFLASTRPTYNAKAQKAEKQRRKLLKKFILVQRPIAERQQGHVYTEPSCELLLNDARAMCSQASLATNKVHAQLFTQP